MQVIGKHSKFYSHWSLPLRTQSFGSSVGQRTGSRQLEKLVLVIRRQTVEVCGTLQAYYSQGMATVKR